MSYSLLRIAFFVSIFAANYSYGQIVPLRHGHAHNDYVHKKPLYEALENGFTSIEIDVFLYKDKLVVSHTATALNRKKTIEDLYLNPIKKIISENNGWVYKGLETPVIFMIDFKTNNKPTYLKLQEVLKNFDSILTKYQGDSVIEQNAINILISGDSPMEDLLPQKISLATIDADLSLVNDSLKARIITRYSSPWSRYFSWNGKGSLPKHVYQKLINLIESVHRKGKDIRFYHIPDQPKAWKLLLDSGVDWINTNKLITFRKFYFQEYRR